MKFPGSRRKPLAGFIALLALYLVFSAGAAFASGDESGGGGITVLPDISVFIQMANFLFLVFVLNAILFKPIRKMLIQRKEKIQSLEDGIDAFQADAKETEDAFTSGIKKARAFGLKEKQSLVEAANEQEKAIVEKIHQQAQAELAVIREKVAKEAATAKTELLKEVDGFANSISEKILGRAV